jgi:hypothetical protein
MSTCRCWGKSGYSGITGLLGGPRRRRSRHIERHVGGESGVGQDRRGVVDDHLDARLLGGEDRDPAAEDQRGPGPGVRAGPASRADGLRWASRRFGRRGAPLVASLWCGPGGAVPLALLVGDLRFRRDYRRCAEGDRRGQRASPGAASRTLPSQAAGEDRCGTGQGPRPGRRADATA